MVLLGVGAMLSYGNPVDTPVWVLVVPLGLLAVNLTAAILSNSGINHQPGLLIFHVSLLSTVVLAGVGRLTHLDAHMELALGQSFSKDLLQEVQKGPWHAGNLDKVMFTQGPYTVQYAANLQRGLTHSEVLVPGLDGQMVPRDVGDDRPLVIERYRFYTSFNKGFSPILTWIPDKGQSITGRINMPAYPLYDYKQDNHWTPPGTHEEINFWLQLKTGITPDQAWVLDSRNSSGVLVVTTKDKRIELKPGEEAHLKHGRLRYDRLSAWMGYRVFYDPTIHWLFFVTVTGVLGLIHYFWKKLNLSPWMTEDTEDTTESRTNEVRA
jgi:hypothetical protein